MTVGTAAIEKTSSGSRVIGSVARMTFGAKPRHARFQQAVVDAAMRLMAIGTIIRNRRMLMEKRPAPLGVAGITVLVDARLLELRRIGRAMRVVAVRAGDFAFP